MAHKSIEQVVNREVAIPRTEQRVLHSREGNREYRIFVAKPREAPPASGYPVIYLLDANSVFATMVEAIRVQARRSDRTGVVPAVIVGIGYQTEEPFSPARHYDFTLPTAVDELPQRPDGRDWPEHGGAEGFLKFIEDDLKPMIESEYKIDTRRQAIFGHSLGGLFALHVLFTKPDAFQTYIAGSPSIHWNKRLLLQQEQDFTARLKQERMDLRVLLAAGELERTHKSRITDNAKEMTERLTNLSSYGVHAEFKEFEDEGHISVLPVLISRGLRFALSPSSVERN